VSNKFRFRTALIGDQWQDNVEILVSDTGLIEQIEFNVAGDVEDLIALPGMINVHSHAFQRGFAGLSEFRTTTHDSFWTWRKLMYDFVGRLSPEDVYSIARQLYSEMLAAGYTWVGEFHYLHNAPDGDSYTNRGEMSDAIFRAANDTGIGLCHLPVLYQRGGFEDEPIAPGQNRFVLNDEHFFDLVEHCRSKSVGHSNRNFGIALHSLRAVSSEAASAAVAHVKQLDLDAPIHIHVAEQTAELDACVSKHGKRSVEFMFDSLPIDESWCLIHATHLNDVELSLIAESKAVVAGGRIGIGSDSHCSIDFREELRLLEYGQRLTMRRRAILGTDDVSVGRNLYCQAAAGGARALGINAGEIGVGKRADFTLVDPALPISATQSLA